MKLAVSLIITFVLCTTLKSQQTYYNTDEDKQYRQAVELYNNGKYSAAQVLFDEYAAMYAGENSDEVSGSQFYASMCAVKLFNNDAEARIIKFLNDNPENPNKNEALFNLAGYFFQKKSYSNALIYYEQVDNTRLSKDDNAEYEFKRGYCYFVKEDYDKARMAFNEIKDLDTKYTAPALYYYAHINYTQGNYETALAGFNRLKDDQNFGPIVPYYLTQIYYKQKKYDEVIKYAPQLMTDASEKRGPEIARITGESYVQMNLYEEAIPYLEKFIESGSNVTSEDKYSLAYAYYKTGAFEKAANLFSQITGSETALSQNALYHLADCQIKLNDKNKARMAFSSASKMSFDPAIQEDALFNYALLTYELDYSPFNEAVQSLNEYLEKYPNSKRSEEATNYLVLAYLNAKNYSLALESIEKLHGMNNEIKKAYQKIAYYRGLELFSNLSFDQAIDMFSSADKYGNFDNKIYALCHYWMGEAWYRKGDYSKALDNYNAFLAQPGVSSYPEYAPANYNLGYCYFSQKQYPDAAVWFGKYVSLAKNPQKEVLSDAYNRLGDCYFVQQQYLKAVGYYDNALKNGSGANDYTMFQKAMALGVTGKDNEKINVLNQMLTTYPNSSYKPDVYFQIAESNVKLNQNDMAISNYRRVVNDYPRSSYVKKSLLALGLLYYNANRNNDAITSYKKVIEDYPGTPEAENAMIGLKNVYVDDKNVEGFYAYMKDKGQLTSSDLIEQDSLMYLTAERTYMSGDYAKAQQSLSSYIEKNPDGRYLVNAWFYKGDCHYRNKEDGPALEAFDYVINSPRSKFTEPALLGASRIKFRQKDYAAAADYYQKLEENAEVQANRLEARMGMLECYSMLGDNPKVIEQADRILLSEKLSKDQERKTRFAKAKALQANDRQMLALEEYQKVAVEVKSAEGAESKFRLAEIYYQRKDYANAEKVIADFADKTTPHQYWMAKGFLLWADIFKEKGDDFQAIQTLQSLIDYYEKTDDGILVEAKEKKKQLTDRQNNAGKAKPEQDDQEIEIR
ncbi:MAG TPA: tetratricopeptide repeat protein [Bacteroidales bacterium]|nr:tetratricopeptide repeat protein [Bacteroidales bacterium]